jgi:hypothetical protein
MHGTPTAREEPDVAINPDCGILQNIVRVRPAHHSSYVLTKWSMQSPQQFFERRNITLLSQQHQHRFALI